MPFFFKQWGGWGADGKKRPKKNRRQLNGKIFNEMPNQMSLYGLQKKQPLRGFL